MNEDMEDPARKLRQAQDLEEIDAMADRLIRRIKALGDTREVAISAQCVNDAIDLIKTAVLWPRRYPPA